ncbi:uncharacterized protein LMH87_007629 [Akanthomyces muscarius]|uniref:Secreted protein n=1 Tax=Akanthomyces muscarius TaxID=2231603 RepID=A0A9W8QMX4_AKAMU|nr:uncharacterized protein LMH87_007629 [Akanthomyces muscarius]KAJ4161598.1 hypothetical protein LMH87_007629 [Akanthomyces muscarius]
MCWRTTISGVLPLLAYYQARSWKVRNSNSSENWVKTKSSRLLVKHRFDRPLQYRLATSYKHVEAKISGTTPAKRFP